MAESISSLYLRLGLQNDLESGFTAASSSLRENMARLSRQNTIIRLQAELDLSGVEDAEARLRIQQEALNQQIAIQQDRLRLAQAALINAERTTGEFSDETQRARITIERERLSLENLRRELEHLNETQDDTNDGQNELSNVFSGVSGKTAAVTAGVTAVAGAITATATSTQELIDKFRELQQQSYELNMNVNKTENFLRHLRLGGGDIGDFEGYIRGITDAYVKGDKDDPEFIALDKFGAKITDATGRLKDFQAITEEVYQAWKKAEAAGEGIEFLQLTGGEAGVRDAIQYFKRYEEALEDAAKVFDANLNPEELHQLDREMKLLSEQTDEFKDALADATTPIARAATKGLFELFRDGTEYISENKDIIQKWEFRAIEAVKSVKSVLSELINMSKPLSESAGFKSFTDSQNAELNEVHKTIDELNKWNNTLWGRSTDKFFGDLYSGLFKRAEKSQKEYNQQFQQGMAENQKSWADFRRETEQPFNLDNNPLSQSAVKRIKDFKDELEDLRAELDNWNNDIGQAQAENALWLKRELNDKTHVSEEERQAILKLYAAKEEKIEKERAENIKNIREEEAARYRSDLENEIADAEKAKEEWIKIGMDKAEAEELAQKRINKAQEEAAKKAQEYIREAADIEYSLSHTAFEKQLYDIERWKEAQLERADTAEEVAAIVKDAAMKETEAFEREVERIKGLTQSLEDEIFELEHSQYEADRRRAMQKAQKALDEGVDYATVQRYLQAKLAQLDERAAKGGDYTKPPKGNQNQYFVEFGQNPAKDLIGLFTDEERIRTQLNNKLAGSTNNLIDAQNLLADKSKQAFEIIEGDRAAISRYFTEFENQNGHVEDEMSEYLPDLNQTLQDLPAELKNVLEGISSGNIYKDNQGNYHANNGYEAMLSNYFTSLEDLGLDTQQAFSYLDEATARMQDMLSAFNQNVQQGQRQGQQNINVAPNINIDLGGAYVFDESMKRSLTDDIIRGVADGVTSAVQRATSNQSYSYAS